MNITKQNKKPSLYYLVIYIKIDPGLDSVSRKNDIKDISEIMDKYKMCITKVIISMLNFLNLIAVLGSINNILILWKCTLKF